MDIKMDYDILTKNEIGQMLIDKNFIFQYKRSRFEFSDELIEEGKNGVWVVAEYLSKKRNKETLDSENYTSFDKTFFVTFIHKDYKEIITPEKIINDGILVKDDVLNMHNDKASKSTHLKITGDKDIAIKDFIIKNNLFDIENSSYWKANYTNIDNSYLKDNSIVLGLGHENYYGSSNLYTLKENGLAIGYLLEFNMAYQTEIFKIGEIKLNNSLFIGEPVSKKEKPEIKLDNIAEGRWEVFVEKQKHRFGYLSSKLFIKKKDINLDLKDINIKNDKPLYTGGATLGFFHEDVIDDKDYFTPEEEKPSEEDYLYWTCVAKVRTPTNKRVGYNAGILEDKVVVSRTGVGDGDYYYYTHTNDEDEIDGIYLEFME